MDRGIRRQRTVAKGVTRRKAHLARIHPDGVVDCVCDKSVWRFSKHRAFGCGCRKKTKGRPKLGNGMCKGNGLRPTVKQRLLWRDKGRFESGE